jgi:glycosyltransferase involved in cell wall biosynthesis
MQTVLILTMNFPPTNIVGAFRPFRLVKLLDRQGVRCEVITTYPAPDTALDADHLDALTARATIHYLYRELSICGAGAAHHCFAAGSSKPLARGLRRLQGRARHLGNRWIKPDPDILHLPAFLAKALKIGRRCPPDVVLTTSPPHSLHLAGLILARRWSVPWVVDFRDPWDSYTHSGKAALDHPISRRLKHLVVNRAQAVISTTPTYTRLLIDEGHTPHTDKFHTVTNCFDSALVLERVSKSPEHFVISYVGIFYPQKDPYTFFRALRTWLDRLEEGQRQNVVKRLRVQLIGSGDATTRSRVTNLGLDEVVRFIDRVPHEDALGLLQQSDMALISTGLGAQTRPGWLPSKLFEYLGCRIPILAITPEGEAADIIRRTDSGFVVTSEDHAAIGRILDTEMARKFNGTGLQVRPFTFAGVERYGESQVMEQMARILRSTAQGSSPAGTEPATITP